MSMSTSRSAVDTFAADARAAYRLGTVFKTLAVLCAVAAVLGGLLIAAEPIAFVVVAGLGLVIAALFAFLGYVLALLVGIHDRLDRHRDPADL
jgi:hypothetical protein